MGTGLSVGKSMMVACQVIAAGGSFPKGPAAGEGWTTFQLFRYI